MGNHKGLLSRLVEALVEEWGYEQVALELSHADELLRVSTDQSRAPSSGSRNKRKSKLLPTEQVRRVPLDPARREAVLQLADRYEKGQFLPSVGAVKEFLTMMGYEPRPMKDRDQAFRILLLGLLQLPTDRLQQLLSSSLYSGPSELGPISEAIAAAGEHLPRGSRRVDTEISEHGEHGNIYSTMSKVR